jgi:RNA polymerase sigma-70 factor, ECF subfamily
MHPVRRSEPAPTDARSLAASGSVSDAEIVARVVAGEVELFEVLMRRHNQRLFRTARAIVRDDAEAEDVM